MSEPVDLLHKPTDEPKSGDMTVAARAGLTARQQVAVAINTTEEAATFFRLWSEKETDQRLHRQETRR
jgi:hypothetical protein